MPAPRPASRYAPTDAQSAPRDTTTVLKKLAPGAPGTRRHSERFGESLVCVRYRDDPARNRRITTVEIIVDDRPAPLAKQGKSYVRVGLREIDLRTLIKQAGGRWDGQKKLWLLPNAMIRRLRLTPRVVQPAIDAKA